jgi:hypothetical protein
MDAGRYSALKAEGKVKLVKVNEEYVLVLANRYDPDTGKLAPPESSPLGLKQLNEMRQKVADGLASIDAMIADVTAALAK